MKGNKVPADEPAKMVGTGLGLAICKEIVKVHNDEIGVESMQIT